MGGCGGDDDDILGHEIHVTQGALVGVTEKGTARGSKDKYNENDNDKDKDKDKEG